MTDSVGPGVPSPQEELRAETAALAFALMDWTDWSEPDAQRVADFVMPRIAPLFAARVAAIEADARSMRDRWMEERQRAGKAEAEAFEHKEARAELNERCTQYRERADRAEAELTALREQLRLCNIDQANTEAELSHEIHVDMLRAANNEQYDLAVFHSQRADKAQAAWDEGYRTGRSDAMWIDQDSRHGESTNPYLAAGVPATPEGDVVTEPCCFPGCHQEWNPHPIPCPGCSTAAGARTPGLASTPIHQSTPEEPPALGDRT